MKKYLSIAAAMATALLLAACGSGNAQTTAAVTETDAPETTAAEAVSEETTTQEETTTEAEEEINWDDDSISYVYGTATLSFAEFYSGDVSSTDSYDVISSATNSKYSIMGNIASDFVDEVTNAEGYHITGVKNVAVAVPEDSVEDYMALNDTFVLSDAEPPQYKKTAIIDGEAVYSPTVFNVADTVTDADAVLETGSVWGDYLVKVTDPEGTTYLRNTREDEGFAIGSDIQGIILTTDSGLKVGMEYLQSIWVQPYEVSWNVSADNSHNTHIAEWDNMDELDKLTGETITEIMYIMPDSAYVYTFDGIYVKPIYSGDADVKAEFTEGSAQVKVEGIPADLENATVSVVMGTGRGKTTLADSAALENGTVTMINEDGSEAVYDPTQVYTVTVNSDNFAGLDAAIPASEMEKTQLSELIARAEEVLALNTDEGVKEHKEEAEELLKETEITSGDVQELISELTSHLSVYESGE